MTENETSKIVVDCAFQIHTAIGPGLLESVYEAVLTYELEKRGCKVVRQQAIPVVYENVHLEVGFRADLIVNDKVIVEIKIRRSELAGLSETVANLFTLERQKLGLLINFNVELIKDGIRRVVNNL